MSKTGTIVVHITKNYNMKYIAVVFLALIFYFGAFAQNFSSANIDESGMNIEDRITVPEGYIRPPFPENTFQYYLRTLPLKGADAKVVKYDGYDKFFDCYDAVLDVNFQKDVDLIHGEHAVQLLRSKYLYESSKYELINFSFDDNRDLNFQEYGDGYRWVWQDSAYVKIETATSNFSENTFNEYLNEVFNNSTARGLMADTRGIKFSEISTGDVFIQPGNKHAKGHAVIVLDLIVDPMTGERLVLLGQGFNPTQDIHILRNPFETDISPWYRVDEDSFYFTTIQWNFRKKHSRRFIINANTES